MQTRPAGSTSSTPLAGDARIEHEEQLFAPFRAAFENPGQRIGLEAEKFGIRSDGSPVRYHEERGIRAMFDELVARYGWRAEGETEGAPPIALFRGPESITLEPGSQFELSGSPVEDVHAVMAEVEGHRTELASLQCAQDVHWIGLGFHPLARQEDLDWVPKSRYVTMRAYLPTRGAHGLDMMRRTATVQANFDIASERDAMDKLRVSLAVAPVVQALFANSAVYENVRHAAKSRRAEVWLDVDNDRSGMLPFAWKPDASLGDYVRWALDVPMFIVKRNGVAIPNTKQTFRTFMAQGIEGHHALASDWEMHLNTLFPEVRLKKTLEVRSADGVPGLWGAALPALWTGILYDPSALEAAGRIVCPFGVDAWTAARPAIAHDGLAARVAGTPLRDLAVPLIDLALEALRRRARKNAAGQDERIYLEPLRALAERGASIGDEILGDWTPDAPNARAELFRRARY